MVNSGLKKSWFLFPAESERQIWEQGNGRMGRVCVQSGGMQQPRGSIRMRSSPTVFVRGSVVSGLISQCRDLQLKTPGLDKLTEIVLL